MRRVVVTGMGTLNPVGTGLKETWESLTAGKSGIDRFTKFDVSEYRSQVGGEVKGFDAKNYLDPKEAKRTDLFVQYGLAGTQMAMEDAGLSADNGAYDPNRVGVVLGTGLGGLVTLEKNHKVLLEKGPGRISPFLIPMMIANMAPGQIAIAANAKGPNLCVVTACASGTHAVGDAFKLIQQGAADAMITGGTEGSITPLSLAGFCNMKALTERNDEPQKASRPFEKDRDGFVMAEGVGILILEELEQAKKRGAKIYCEIVGYGKTGDAHHITAPSPGGAGAAQCIKMALDDANINPHQVDYINAHGTSTPFNDLCETQAIKTVFNSHSGNLMISATKSMTGHLLGAAGAVEAIFTALALQNGVLPPTINYDTPDPECDLDYIPYEAREKEVTYAISNSFGFGGTNGTLAFKRFE